MTPHVILVPMSLYGYNLLISGDIPTQRLQKNRFEGISCVETKGVCRMRLFRSLPKLKQKAKD
jgi:hypothetical protein